MIDVDFDVGDVIIGKSYGYIFDLKIFVFYLSEVMVLILLEMLFGDYFVFFFVNSDVVVLNEDLFNNLMVVFL